MVFLHPYIVLLSSVVRKVEPHMTDLMNDVSHTHIVSNPSRSSLFRNPRGSPAPTSRVHGGKVAAESAGPPGANVAASRILGDKAEI